MALSMMIPSLVTAFLRPDGKTMKNGIVAGYFGGLTFAFGIILYQALQVTEPIISSESYPNVFLAIFMSAFNLAICGLTAAEFLVAAVAVGFVAGSVFQQQILEYKG